MKFKPTDKTGGVLVELGPRESQQPAMPVAKAASALPAFKLKRILVPIDFSDCSKKALGYAIPFAEQFGAELMLLHVLPSCRPMLEMAKVLLDTVEDGNKALKELREMIPDAVRSSTVIRRGGFKEH